MSYSQTMVVAGAPKSHTFAVAGMASSALAAEAGNRGVIVPGVDRMAMRQLAVTGGCTIGLTIFAASMIRPPATLGRHKAVLALSTLTAAVMGAYVGLRVHQLADSAPPGIGPEKAVMIPLCGVYLAVAAITGLAVPLLFAKIVAMIWEDLG